MSRLNPVAVWFTALCAVIGALAGNVLAGLAIGLGLCILATITNQ